jgi:hypothetical protein
MHGNWRKVEETEAAINLIGKTLDKMHIADVTWLLDKPVSNSGRLAGIIRELAASRGAAWRVELIDDVDGALDASVGLVVSADSVVIDGAKGWENLARGIVRDELPGAWLIDFSDVALP